MAMNESQVTSAVGDLWQMGADTAWQHDRVYGYLHGELGSVELPQGANEEVKQIGRLSIKNVLGLVVSSFAQNLAVVGYRRSDTQDNDAAWGLWQAQRMDARQNEVHKSALTYGTSYVMVIPGVTGELVFRPRSPRQIMTAYADPQIDAWPLHALETWTDMSGSRPRIKGIFVDEDLAYPVDLGEKTTSGPLRLSPRIESMEQAFPHGAGVCPVVRFINDRDAEDIVIGEVDPLIREQRAINSVNFDRMIVSRFGAFPQKVISGWTSTPDQVLKASASRVWTFGDQEVRAQSLPGASVDGYNAILTEMLEHVAMTAQISPAAVTGKMVNLSADALAAGEANQQRKLKAKRDTFGESWEQVLQLAASMDGDTVTATDSGAEVVWRDTEARSFGSVVDGVTKLSSVGIPIDELLPLVPGLSQQQQVAIKDRLASSDDLMNALQGLSSGGPQVEDK